jgi:hypothetical protein
MKKKGSFFGWKYWDIFFWRKNPMGSSTNPMSKCEKQSVLFIFEHKYAQSHPKKKKTLWFAQWNMELNCLMLTMHTHKMSQGNFTRLWWIRHSTMEIDDSRYKWNLIVDVLQFYGFGMTISTLGKNNWCFQHLEVNLHFQWI